jgi:hypothetical protein
MAMQGPRPQGFYGLNDDLIIRHFWGLSFELKKPSVKVRKCFFLSLSIGQKIFFTIELRLEPLEVEQKLLF